MANTVKSFKELTPDLQAFAGGKGGILARMFQDGYPVPEGFVVVGCGNATTRLKTGDRVFVDGGQGVVQILN